MSKCEQCIVREFSSLKALNKDELVKLSECKESYTIKKGDVIFEEGETINGIYCIKDGVCKLSKLSANGKDHNHRCSYDCNGRNSQTLRRYSHNDRR